MPKSATARNTSLPKVRTRKGGKAIAKGAEAMVKPGSRMRRLRVDAHAEEHAVEAGREERIPGETLKISVRVNAATLALAGEKRGLSSTSDIINAALRSLVEPDPFQAWMRSEKVVLSDDLERAV